MPTSTTTQGITAAEFGRMQDACVFRDRHVQLLDGELYEVTKNPPHNQAVTALADARALASAPGPVPGSGREVDRALGQLVA